MQRILVLVGTRPEAIKLAPVIIELRARSTAFDVQVCASGQHREMLEQALRDFGIDVDIRLDVMTHNQTLGTLTARLFDALDPVVADVRPDWVLVQGDTSTVMVAALVGFYHGVQVAHVEAGLRTGDLRRPFPEELNRRIAGVVANQHFAPTDVARANLLAEGVAAESVAVTGNTVVDALLAMRERVREQPPGLPDDVAQRMAASEQLVLITGHRRENFGEGFDNIFGALAEVARAHTDVLLVYPVHLNPNVRKPVHALLSDVPNIVLCEPVSYPQIIYLMDRAALVVTDSGGIQEEAVSMGKPVLVTREVTERPEGLSSGLMRIVGVQRQAIVDAIAQTLQAPPTVPQGFVSPYGDGQASKRIADGLQAAQS